MIAPDLDLRALLEVENASEVIQLREEHTGVPAWPSVRNEFLRTMIGDLVYAGRPLRSPTPRRAIFRVFANGLRTVVERSSRRVSPTEVLILGTGAGMERRDGTWANRNVDDLARSLGTRAWTLMGPPGDRILSGPRWNPRSTYVGDLRFMTLTHGVVGVRPKHRALASEVIDCVADRARDLLGWELGGQRRSELQSFAARRLAAYAAVARWWANELQRFKPAVLVAEEAGYGHGAVMCATAKAFGVHVAELQHGVITRSHDAYNVAPAMAASGDYVATQPDTLLTYGPWWAGQVSAPIANKVAIGSPLRERELGAMRETTESHDVTILGDGIETGRTLAFAEEVAQQLGPAFTIVFRPHPLEHDRARSANPSGVQVRVGGSLYAQLRRSIAVVAEASTTLFEAISVVPKILVWDTPKSRFYLPEHPFIPVSDAPAVADQVRSSDGRPPPAPDDYWVDGWEGRWRAWVDGRVIDRSRHPKP